MKGYEVVGEINFFEIFYWFVEKSVEFVYWVCIRRIYLFDDEIENDDFMEGKLGRREFKGYKEIVCVFMCVCVNVYMYRWKREWEKENKKEKKKN